MSLPVPAARLACVPLLLAAAACASGRGAGGAVPRGSAAADTAWFEGTIAYTLPDGRAVGSSGVLVERRTAPDAREVVEVVTTQSRRPGAPPDRYEVHMQVDAAGTGFAMRESSGAFTGDGTLEGPAWRWTSWGSVSRLPDGSRVESSDSLAAGGGALRVRKRVSGPGGALRITTLEELRRISRGVYEARQAAWRTPSP